MFVITPLPKWSANENSCNQQSGPNFKAILLPFAEETDNYRTASCILTNWFVPSDGNTSKGLEELPLCCNEGISPGVWVEGVEGAELGEGPVVFAVPELLAGPEDETGCFRLRPP